MNTVEKHTLKVPCPVQNLLIATVAHYIVSHTESCVLMISGVFWGSQAHQEAPYHMLCRST